jgi:hypothetical protein
VAKRKAAKKASPHDPPATRTLVFAGESFTVADRIGLMPLMRFAVLAKDGVDIDDMEGLVAVYDLLRQCITDEDWPRFEAHASRARAGEDELLQVVKDAIELITAHPTRRPSDSSAGQLSTSGPSADGSGSPVTSLIERLEREGRPSIAYMVAQAQDSRASG